MSEHTTTPVDEKVAGKRVQRSRAPFMLNFVLRQEIGRSYILPSKPPRLAPILSPKSYSRHDNKVLEESELKVYLDQIDEAYKVGPKDKYKEPTLESQRCTEVFAPLIDCQEDAPSTPAAPTVPNSPDPLALFSEDGICLADGNWSMDYWDPYGLDAGLRDHKATAVDLAACVWVPLPLESGELEMGPVPDQLLEVFKWMVEISAPSLPSVPPLGQGDSIPPPTAVTPLYPAPGPPPPGQGNGVQAQAAMRYGWYIDSLIEIDKTDRRLNFPMKMCNMMKLQAFINQAK